jgi:hypothetical protein
MRMIDAQGQALPRTRLACAATSASTSLPEAAEAPDLLHKVAGFGSVSW